MIIVSLLSSSAYAASSYGTSTIVLNKTTVDIALGGSAAVGYSVNLSSGKTWGTNFIVDNQSALQQNGIYLSPSVSAGEPPFSGVLSVRLTQYAKPGTYIAALSATGDDPSTSDAMLTIVVSQSAPVNNSGSSTGQPTGQQAQGASGSPGWIYALAIAIVIIAVAAFLFFGRKKAKV